MADYYSILSKTVSGLPTNTASNRSFVYSKARQAIEARLRLMTPSPGADAIARQMQILDEAVRRIEHEQSQLHPAPGAQGQAAGQLQAAPQAGPRPQSAPAIAVREPEIVPIRPQPATPAYDSSLDAIDDLGRMGAGRRGQNGRERRAGGIAGAFISFLLLAMLAAGGYGLWINKEPLMAALGIKNPNAPQRDAAKIEEPKAAGEAGPVVREAGGEDKAEDKEDVRLNESGESVAGQPKEQSGAQQESAADPGSAPNQQAGQQQAGQVNPVNEGGQANQVGGQAGGQTQAAGEGSGQALPAIGQKAFLYEEGSAGAGATRDNAAVVWSLVQEAPAEGAPPEPVIRGNFDVPGRGLTLQLSIKRNTDEALPASHVIEMLFTAAADFSGGNVDNVARFVMKANEQARGEQLVAVPARIDTGFFLIALNNLPQAVDTNRKLLLETSWIDIPVGYASGKRGLLALEKGALGDKVFRDAFADWDKRQ